MPDTNIVEIENLSYSYNGEKTLDKIDLEIKSGDFVGLIGPNGSGKSTLLKIIVGLLTPNSGTIRLFGQDIKTFSEWPKIGYLPQKTPLNLIRFPFTVEEILQTTEVSNSEIRNLLKQIGMERFAKRQLSQLSGGEQQRVFLARALAHKPQLLLLDEPTVGVDAQSQESFYKLLESLNQEHGITLVLVSHDIDVVAHQVKTIACINKSLLCHGKPSEVMKGNFLTELYGKHLKIITHHHA